MAKTKQQKEIEAKKLKEGFEEAKSVVFTTFDGLTVAETEKLRNDLRNEGVSYVACKKTLLKKALANQKIEGVDPASFDGSVALAFGMEDEVAPAKIVANFAKNKESLKIQGGILEGAFIAAEKVLELSKLPSRDELIAKTVGTIKAPITGFVNVLAGNMRNLVNVLNSIKEVKN